MMKTHPDKVLLEPHTLESAGVDWITCTLSREFPEKNLRDIAFNLLEAEESAGNVCSPWNVRGYVGYQAGGVCIGVRKDSWCVQLSSTVAREHWRAAYLASTNISRLDVQTTVRFQSPQPYIIQTLHRDALAHKTRCGRPSERRLITSSTKGDTLYIGQRVSEVYLRAYDKGVEEKSEVRGTLLRYEAEMKGKRARQTASALSQVASELEASRALISTMFRRESIRVSASSDQWQLDSLSRRVSTASRKLAWVRSSVSPSIRFLLKHYTRVEIEEALGLLSERQPESDIEEGG
jgi:hypothetical protein